MISRKAHLMRRIEIVTDLVAKSLKQQELAKAKQQRKKRLAKMRVDSQR
jgi:hypothetical protein